MASYYDEVEVRAPTQKMEKTQLTSKQIEDMEFDEENLLFHSPCPCGDRFEISLVNSTFVLYLLPVTNCCAEQTQLQEGEDIATCPSCSLIIRVIYDPVVNLLEDELILKDDFVDDEKENGKEVNAMVEVAVQ